MRPIAGFTSEEHIQSREHRLNRRNPNIWEEVDIVLGPVVYILIKNIIDLFIESLLIYIDLSNPSFLSYK